VTDPQACVEVGVLVRQSVEARLVVGAKDRQRGHDPILGEMATMPRVPVIALIDGEHHPAAVRGVLSGLDLAGVVFCGGEEKLGPGPLEEHYGRPVETEPEEALRRLAAGADAVVDLADEPVLPPRAKLRLAALALHLGLRYEAPGLRLDPPRYEPVAFDGPTLAVIATGKRTGKTALACHTARLLREHEPVIVCMGRGGPARPVVASPETSLDDLLAIADGGAHAASDYLEDAVLAGVPTIGCRRVGGGLAGAPAESNVPEGAALAASLEPGLIMFEGSGSCIPPVEVDRTVCIVGPGEPEPLSDYSLLRADLVLAHRGAAVPPGALRFELRPEPAEPLPDGARVALFTTGARQCEGVEPVVASTNLARRSALADDLDRAIAERCDLWLTELKAAAVDTVAARARAEGVRVAFVRNRPVGDGLDDALVELYRDAT
jgi:cyclic 2,3-diphosphoglycerate synthase